MKLTGQQLIGQGNFDASGSVVWAINPSSGEKLQPGYLSGGKAEVVHACELAEAASVAFRTTSLEERATFLETIAEEIEAIGDSLIERCTQETGLPAARIQGERGRTCGQLRLFASVVRSGEWLDVRIDPALPERQPLPRADLRHQNIALGPVAVFGASNFPLAFSVAGGDTASALAAGCPVIVKAHSAHPGTSEMVGRAIQNAIAKCNLPEGVFSLLYGSGNELGQALVSDPRIKAVGFTGSRSGGTALMATAQARKQPIPVYAEMSSINPVFLLPTALKTRTDQLAESFIASLAMGAGQFCTNPGLVLAVRGTALNNFLKTAEQAITKVAAQTMLTPGIYKAYSDGIISLTNNDAVHSQGSGEQGEQPNLCQSHLFVTQANHFLNDERLLEEVFGSCSLVIECDDIEQMLLVTRQLEGQLTATLQMDDGDLKTAKALLPILEEKAGRILVNGWPTGVEVCHAMVHGGPFPATSDSRSTSVGSAAIFRFLRPVCYQNLPQTLLPNALRDNNPAGISHLFDGKRMS
ncbi:2,5-dioxovalerate dehydrogenase [Marinomonas ushuaiensis DSM 15871]|uniref:2,5-dioxovalerate dehydrogenase n=1 Tax=Marinomonas ushuaiensis DSM 15871 TaxID=1122207 RepID=X7E2I6_9GAMM|nr:aldehyde dehydrogenase (NADP(+)) [Marinomonas ushuaiensis]ETX10080.1 2,5-dioxovalerate dehydrogenase [Marinomonas ushuaiensis DSM 15871]